MEDSIKYINIDDLIPGKLQAHFENIGDNINDLANSISKHGIIVPLIVRKKGIQQYEIILGNRRYNAAKMVGLKQVPVIIINADDEKALDIIISDNIQRRELTAKEEAYLYNKDLEYTNNNEKGLSDKLGIPIDRIISKLSSIRKGYEKPKETKENNTNNILSSNSINQDIISLSELNKEEREDSNMNDDIINNQNLNADPSKVPSPQQPSQEPTFGGRFFPSLEDEPTNINQNNSSFLNSNNNVPSQSLIDLTDTSIPNNDISHNNNGLYNSNINNPNDIQQEQPALPNLDALSTNITDNNQYQFNQPINKTSEIPQSIENNNINNNQPINIESPQSMSLNPPIESSALETNYNMNNINGQLIDSGVNDNEYNKPNNNYEPTPNNNIETTQVPSLDNNTPMNQNINMVNEAMNYNNKSETNIEQKDIIPVINMIKSLAINIENLGYNLDISEEENNEVYSIKIEVEK